MNGSRNHRLSPDDGRILPGHVVSRTAIGPLTRTPLSKYTPVVNEKPHSVKIMAKAPINKRLSEPSRFRAHPTKTGSVADLIAAGLLPEGFTLLPYTHPEAEARAEQLRRAKARQAAIRNGGATDETRAAARAEYEWVHKNADTKR